MQTEVFQFCGHFLVSQFFPYIKHSTLKASPFGICNSPGGIPSLSLALLTVMLPKAHLTPWCLALGEWSLHHGYQLLFILLWLFVFYFFLNAKSLQQTFLIKYVSLGRIRWGRRTWSSSFCTNASRIHLQMEQVCWTLAEDLGYPGQERSPCNHRTKESIKKKEEKR